MAGGHEYVFPHRGSMEVLGRNGWTWETVYSGLTLRQYVAVEIAKGILSAGHINASEYPNFEDTVMAITDKLIARL